MRESIQRRALELQPRLVECRRDLHRHPELAFEERRTGGIVAEWLRSLGLEVHTGIARTGVAARLRGALPGRTVAVRADMDALPVQDAKSCEYASVAPGKTHACGHDAHVAMALGAATLLREVREGFAGDVVFLFQPAEEGDGGALRMIEEGALDGVELVLGQHVEPRLPAGEIGLIEGATMAACDDFRLRILGTGGHGALPHLAVDAVVAAAHVVTALQTIVARSVDPLQAAVLSIGTISGGSAVNVVADSVELAGTVRTFDRTLREEMPRRIEQIAASVAAAFGARSVLEYTRSYPALINPPAGVELIRGVAERALGRERVRRIQPMLGSEDFAYYLERVPGCFYFLGCRHPQPTVAGYGLHHPAFDLDESVLAIGARLLAEGALGFLERDAAGNPGTARASG